MQRQSAPHFKRGLGESLGSLPNVIQRSILGSQCCRQSAQYRFGGVEGCLRTHLCQRCHHFFTIGHAPLVTNVLFILREQTSRVNTDFVFSAWLDDSSTWRRVRRRRLTGAHCASALARRHEAGRRREPRPSVLTTRPQSARVGPLSARVGPFAILWFSPQGFTRVPTLSVLWLSAREPSSLQRDHANFAKVRRGFVRQRPP